jgi:hypothetical protein
MESRPIMGRASWVRRGGWVLAWLLVTGCQQQDELLTESNFQQRFSEIENTNNNQPGTLTDNDVRAVLGPGQIVHSGDPSIRDLPPGVVNGELNWLMWSKGNEQLIVGFADNHVATICRMRR